MSASWSRLAAALVVMAAVLVTGSALASGATAQDRPAVGGNVGSQPVGVYDAVRLEVVPVVGSDTAGSAAAIAHIAAAHVYDGPVVSRAGASVSILAETPFHQVTAGGGGVVSSAAEVEGTPTTPVSLTSTPSALPRSGPIPRSLGAASRAEQLAKKLHLNVNSPTTRQVLNSLDDNVADFVGNYRKGSIWRELPGEVADMSVEDALRHSSTVRKLLIDNRFVK